MLFIIMGPSGSGKNTLVDKFLSNTNEFCYAMQCTTRPPRDEEDKKNYYFYKELNKEDCVTYSEFNVILEDGSPGIWKYGIEHQEIDMASHSNVLTISNPSEIDELVNYCNKYEIKYKVIHITAGEDELFIRNGNRKNVHKKEAMRRIMSDMKEINLAFDRHPGVCINNDNFDDAFSSFSYHILRQAE